MIKAADREISILGYATRLPAASGNSEFWSLLTSSRCAVTAVSPDRFPLSRFGHPRPGESGKSYTWAAGQIDDPWGFDAAAFGISPREAVQMDPQQRLLLQVVWEALEHANLSPDSLAGSGTGVYVGASALDYSHSFLFDPPAADIQFMTGNTLSIISNRISYIYDLRGPSFTVDTACSSSLVALHEAAEAIRAGRIDTAIVAGVNLLFSPYSFMGFSRASMLSPTGLCRAFDAAGDGYVRSEGAVVVVLRAADRAREAGNTEVARLLATGLNSDGRTVGMSLPSGEIQAELLATLYREHGFDPDDLAFVEAHGTGTQVGDPAEAFSLGTTLGAGRSSPLLIGSVKTNIGHLEPASGLAGMVKAVMALENDLLPASLHFETPNPNIDFDALNLRVAAGPVPLTRGAKRRLAGINSFGFGGTNAHAVIADPGRRGAPSGGEPHAPLTLSASSARALQELARRYAERIETAQDADLGPILATAAYNRAQLAHRLVITDPDREGKVAALRAFADGEATKGVATGQAASKAGPVVFAFTGNGSQWAGMGRQSYRHDRDFRGAFDRIDRQFMRLSGWSLATMLFSEELDGEIERTEIAQPLLFAIQGALAEALKGRGVEPDAVIGHSVGEVAAAWVAGILDLDDAVRVIHTRSTCQEITRHLGSMAALLLSADEAERALEASGLPGLQVAAINSPRSVTISGPAESLDAFAAFARKQRWALRRLDIAYPFHSALVDPIRDPLLQALEGISPRAPRCRFVSTVHAEAEAPVLDGQYWWENVRQPVRFLQGMKSVLELDPRVVVEIGPAPLLTTYVRDILREADRKAAIVNTLDRKDQAPDVMTQIAAEVYANGGRVDRERLFGPPAAVPAPLPYYPWQNQVFRPETTEESVNAFSGATWPLLGYRRHHDLGEWTNLLDPVLLPWLADHKVDGALVFPATGYAEMALRAAAVWFDGEPVEIRDMDILRPIVFDPEKSTETRLRISADDKVFEIFSRPRLSGGEWSLHVRGTLDRSPQAGGATELVLEDAPGIDVPEPELYDLTRRFGLDYGEAFRRADHVTTRGARMARLALKPPAESVSGMAFALDPTQLDAGLHGLFALLRASGETPRNTGFLPVRFGRLRLLGAQVPESVTIRVDKASPRSIEASFEYLAGDGSVVARLSGARFRAMPLGRAEKPDELVYRTIRHTLPTSAAVSAAMEAGPDLEALARDFAGDVDSEPEEVLLLLEALGQRIAFDALRAIAHDDGRIDPAALVEDGSLAASAHPFATHLLLWLEGTGLAQAGDDGAWTLAADAQLPPAADLLQTVAREAPERIAELALLARLHAELAPLLKTGLPDAAAGCFSAALFEQFRNASPCYRPLADSVCRVADGLFANWPPKEPLRVLLLGAGDAALALRLAERLDPARATLTVTDADAAALTRAERLWSGPAHVRHAGLDALLDGTAGAARFDVMLAAGMLTQLDDVTIAGLRDLLMPRGLLAAAEYRPSPLLDLIMGTGAKWWSQGQDPAFPVSPLRDGAQWASALQVAGFAQTRSANVPSAAIEASMVLARTGDRMAARAVEDDAGQATAPGSVLIHDDSHASRALAAALADQLRESGRTVTLALQADETAKGEDGSWTVGPGGDETQRQAFDALLTGDTDIVHLADAYVNPAAGSGAKPPPATDSDDAMALAGRRAIALKRLLRLIGGGDTRLWVVAPGAMQENLADQRPAQAAVWAFARTALNEYPGAHLRLVDVSPALNAAETATRLADEILHPNHEREIVRGLDGRAGLRLVRGGLLDDTGQGSADPAVRLDIDHQGSLDHLRWRTVPRNEPEDDQVEIAVRASGLNFRDVMWALGLLPEEALEDGFAGPTLGMECAGEVVRTGAGVTRFKPGDRVLTFAPACFASHLVVSERACAPMPSTVGYEAAATIPVTFLTAYYALVELGRLGDGDTVLIHGGAGGVGLAAIQIARWRGATIFATAGSPEKRAYLRLLGVDHVLDSRSLDFADEIRELTGGEGVDVVLNSLFGDAMERSIEVLKPFGRFLELGKRDYFANTRVGLRPFRRNLSYFGIDADQLLTHQPKLAERMFADLVGLFEDGTLAPLPYRLFEAHGVVDAFRVMQQSGHIGKIVLLAPAAPEAAPERPALKLSGDGTYVIAGGFGGFGAEVLRWLARKGVRHMLVASRSGPSSDEAKALVADLEKVSVTVRGVACDVTDHAALAAALEEARASMPPIRGVFHIAMVLEDALLANLSDEAMTRVMAPKIRGAQNLDELTRDDPLETFVLFSSATTLVGNPGQANYVAANGYLEALATRRRAEGRPALAVAWGAISDAGYLARNEDVNELLARKLGRHSLTAAEALEGLERLLALGDGDPATAAVGYARIDWSAARRDLALLETPLVDLLRLAAAGSETDADGAIDLQALLAGLDPVEATKKVAALLANEIGRILRLSPDELDPHRPLSEIGMDSLMALELRMGAERQFGIDIPLMSLANGATLQDLAGRIAARAMGGEEASRVSADARTLAGQHFVDETELDADAAAELAARVEERARNVGKLVE